jgi:MFS family permease
MVRATSRLIAGRAVAALATALIPTTLTLAVVGITGSAADLGVVLACEMLPMLVLLPFGGVLADRFAPQRVALVTDLVRCAAQAAIGVELLLRVDRVADLAVLAAVTGAAVAFGVPAVPRLVTATVRGEDRLRVNARMGVINNMAQVVAPAAAGGLMLAAGPGWSSLLTAVLYAGSATTLGGIRTAPEGRPVSDTRFFGELAEGWREVRRHPWFLASILGHGVWHLAAGLLLTLGPIIAVTGLGGASSWVWIVQSGTVGMVAGVLAAPRLPIRRPLLVVALCAALYALPLAAFALPAPLVVVAAAYAVAMFGLGLLSPLWETTLQRRIPERSLGRVGSFDALISFAARPVGLAVAAPLATLTGTAAPLLVAAVLVAVANASVLLLPGVREPYDVRDRAGASGADLTLADLGRDSTG